MNINILRKKSSKTKLQEETSRTEKKLTRVRTNFKMARKIPTHFEIKDDIVS